MEIGILLIVAVGVWLYIDYQRLGIEKTKINGFRSKQYLLTKTEEKFLNGLEKYVGEKYRVMCQVRLAELISAGNYKEKGYRSRLNKIQSKSIDFVITTKKTKVVAAVELDDWTHNKPARRKRDEVVERILNSAGLPLIRFKVGSDYNFEEINRTVTL